MLHLFYYFALARALLCALHLFSREHRYFVTFSPFCIRDCDKCATISHWIEKHSDVNLSHRRKGVDSFSFMSIKGKCLSGCSSFFCSRLSTIRLCNLERYHERRKENEGRQEKVADSIIDLLQCSPMIRMLYISYVIKIGLWIWIRCWSYLQPINLIK